MELRTGVALVAKVAVEGVWLCWVRGAGAVLTLSMLSNLAPSAALPQKKKLYPGRELSISWQTPKQKWEEPVTPAKEEESGHSKWVTAPGKVLALATESLRLLLSLWAAWQQCLLARYQFLALSRDLLPSLPLWPCLEKELCVQRLLA